VNEAYCRNFNKSRSEIIGHIFIPSIPEEDQEIVRQHFQSLTRENPVGILAHRIIFPDGSIHWQRWSDRAIFDKNGKLVEFQSVGRDITEQKRIEEELRDSEQIRQEIINHLPDPTFAINEKGEVIAWNKAIEDFLGIKARDMIGKGNFEYSIPFYGERRPILIDLAIHPDEALSKNMTVSAE
jgi:PAS domain S-box-containing protein